MKIAILFIICAFLGAIGSIYVLTSNTKREVSSPKKIATVQRSHFSLENAPSDSLRGTMSSLSGTVKWLSRTATESSVLTIPQKTQQGEVLQTGPDGRVSVVLRDLTINIGGNTELEFAQTLPIDIVLRQSSGKVVYTNESSTIPYSIRALHLLTRQLNGQIDITVDDEEGTVTLDVRKGSVDIAFNDTNNITTSLTIPSGRRIVFSDEERTIKNRSLSF